MTVNNPENGSHNNQTMHIPDNEDNGCNRNRGPRPETVEKYREAVELYGATALSNVEICQQCGVSLSGLSRYIGTYYRHLMLERNGIKCSPTEAGRIKLKQRRGQLPETHAKYKEAIAACDSMEKYAEALQLYSTTTESVKSIARRFGFNDCAFGQFIKRHFPELHERHQKLVRQTKEADFVHAMLYGFPP